MCTADKNLEIHNAFVENSTNCMSDGAAIASSKLMAPL